MPIDNYLEKLEGARTHNKVVEPLLNNIVIENPESYIILECRTHSSYSYPDLLVATEGSYHEKSWYECHKALHQEDSFMLTLRQYIDFINLLKTGTVYNGNGILIDPKKLDVMLEDIFAAKDPSRMEWLDTCFRIKDFVHYIDYNFRYVNGNLQPQISEIAEDFRLNSGTDLEGIDLDDWLTRATVHGLPSSNLKEGRMWYFPPNYLTFTVVCFYTGSTHSTLDCCSNPKDSREERRVRPVKIKP